VPHFAQHPPSNVPFAYDITKFNLGGGSSPRRAEGAFGASGTNVIKVSSSVELSINSSPWVSASNPSRGCESA